MKYISKRDLAVVSATAAAFAVMALGIYVSSNFRIVGADKGSQVSDKAPVAKKQDGEGSKPSSSSQPVQRKKDGSGSKSWAHGREAKSPEPGDTARPSSQPVDPAQRNPEVAQVPPAWVPPLVTGPGPIAQARPEGTDVRGEPRDDCGNCRTSPLPAYAPNPEKPEARGMTRQEKIVVGSAIAGSYITSILLSKKHR